MARKTSKGPAAPQGEQPCLRILARVSKEDILYCVATGTKHTIGDLGGRPMFPELPTLRTIGGSNGVFCACCREPQPLSLDPPQVALQAKAP